ncbi:hypothetical protein SEUCBS140593_010198 [Sporothrix eucalyptigena]|uniref:Aldehyde dehydrogenase domain-containing protein n=1 Tax=Sporothrix eucalyptigena TaxID=1812306 RepID=A0ABP0D2A7_9PEZI
MASLNGVELDLVPLLIGGQYTSSSPSVTFPVYSLEEKRDVYLAESANADAAIKAADAAWTAFGTWKKSSAVTRRKILLRYAELLRENEEELVKVQRLETSVIEMWNSSVILGARSIATPVAAGCSVVFKASELCPKTHHLLVEIFRAAGLPGNVINVIQTRREDAVSVTEALISHPSIRKVEFIGSASVGRAIGQLGGKYLTPVLMELGGKGPAIVLADADLEDAAQKCVAGAFLHHGQLCFSTERVIVIKSIAEKFKELLKKAASTFVTGSGISDRIISSSKAKLADAESKGAKFLIGGPEMASDTALKATILTEVTSGMQIFDEEAFGPSFSLYIAEDDRQAIEMANNTQYGLNAAVHSTNIQHALDVAKEIDTAQVHINSMTAHDEPTLPVGGMKGSGWGRNNALWGLKEFTEIKLITVSMKGNNFI